MPSNDAHAGDMPKHIKPVVAGEVAGQIHIIRGQRVLLDSDLAALYGIPTFRFNEAVKRNAPRFPSDFAFQLTNAERLHLTSQTAMSKVGRGGRRTDPWVFTALMSSARS
jgi:hypothetical protein